jgi:hypothetical protein
MKLSALLRPDTLPQAIVLGCVILALAAVFVAFIRKAPFYAFLFAVALLLAVVVVGVFGR